MSHKTEANAVQIGWLNALRKSGRSANVFLCSGECLPCVRITGFDIGSVRIRRGSDVRLVSKANIISIIPLPRPKKPKKDRTEPVKVPSVIVTRKLPVVTVKRRRSLSEDATTPFHL
jgi:sRNA-binding regulator protein Hfq